MTRRCLEGRISGGVGCCNAGGAARQQLLDSGGQDMTTPATSQTAKAVAASILVLYLMGCVGPQQPVGRINPPQPRPSVCGVCGGPVAEVSSIMDDTSKPSRNLSVWNRSICANLLYGAESRICTRCWHAWSSVSGAWSRALEDPREFQKPLHPSILRFPLPAAGDVKSRIVYAQEFDGGCRRESVGLWCVNDPQYVSRVRTYARERKLSLRETRSEGYGFGGQIYVNAEYKY